MTAPLRVRWCDAVIIHRNKLNGRMLPPRNHGSLQTWLPPKNDGFLHTRVSFHKTMMGGKDGKVLRIWVTYFRFKTRIMRKITSVHFWWGEPLPKTTAYGGVGGFDRNNI